jgi:hypothetical protein
VLRLPAGVLPIPSARTRLPTRMKWRVFGPLDETVLAEIDMLMGGQVRAQLHFTAA